MRRSGGPGSTAQFPGLSSHRPCYLFRESDCIRFPDKVASSFAEKQEGRESQDETSPPHTALHTPASATCRSRRPQTTVCATGSAGRWGRDPRRRARPDALPQKPADPPVQTFLLSLGGYPPPQRPTNTQSTGQIETLLSRLPGEVCNSNLSLWLLKSELSNMQSHTQSFPAWGL